MGRIFPNSTAQQRAAVRVQLPLLKPQDFSSGNYPDEGIDVPNAETEEITEEVDEGFNDANDSEIFEGAVMANYVNWTSQSSWSQINGKRRLQRIMREEPSKKPKPATGGRKYHSIF